jgi:glycosyltransferase involved in cell wall biosynthesis
MMNGALSRSISKARGACRSSRANRLTKVPGRFVIDARYVRSRPSGIGSCIAALIARLPALAPEARFHLWTHPECPTPVTAPNVTTQVVRAPADGLRTLLMPAALDPLSPSDVVHFPFSLLGRGLPCKSVVTIHDLMWLEHAAKVDGRPLMRRVRESFYRPGMRHALRHATRLIAVSRATADRIHAVSPESSARVRLIHNAAGPAFVAPSDLQASLRLAATLIGSDAPYYLVIGKNEPYKAHHLVLQAFAREARPGELLVLVQRTRRGAGLSRLAQELGIAGRLRWLPTLSEAELVAVVQAARALLQPSLVEGFGIPALEAMAAGCPVIASDTPALVEVLGGAGLHAAVGDAASLAAAINQLRSDSLREELRARGFERARAFSWDVAARQTLEVYREALAAAPDEAYRA